MCDFLKRISIVLIGVMIFMSGTATSAGARDKDREIFAEYIVPTPPELVAYSRFLVKIVSPYHGANTQEISYEFPPELTGEIGKVVRLVPDESNSNLWKSPEMTAACTTLTDIFSCNIHLTKSNIQALATSPSVQQGLDKQKALQFLRNQGLPRDEFEKRAAVLDHFHGGEPAGILTYEFDVY